jgi:hypothetical protein
MPAAEPVATPGCRLGKARRKQASRDQVLMALKSTVYKASVQIADMDRALYATHQLTLARHPSENRRKADGRLLAFALQVPADDP